MLFKISGTNRKYNIPSKNNRSFDGSFVNNTIYSQNLIQFVKKVGRKNYHILEYSAV
jgi:hypothetical protein